MTPDQIKAYGRGYNAGSNKRWPAHRPPLPPDSPLVANLMKSLTSLCDAVDGECAKFDPEDPMAVLLIREMEKARDAMAAISIYLQETPK